MDVLLLAQTFENATASALATVMMIPDLE